MSREELIASFQDTYKKSFEGSLAQRTANAVRSNRVYREGFHSARQERWSPASISVLPETTFNAARKYCLRGRVAVLNFANPVNPGGGVQQGAMAQEECLCRSSNLFACINNENVFDDYYGYHRSIQNHFFTDRLIYTKDVTVFKDDSEIPQMLPEADWFDVDVITCAAPYLAKRKYTNTAALFELFTSRIKNILEAARENDVAYLVLGAFGCGAFQNPPKLVAEAFYTVLNERGYLHNFEGIIFAIKPTGERCPNFNTFSIQFQEYADDFGKWPEILMEPLELRFHQYTSLHTENERCNDSDFFDWQRESRYFGKQFSVLGDSISTLEGYNPRGYKVFYTGENCTRSGVCEPKDTWWNKVITFLGGELLVNNSWSGSRVTKLPDSDRLFPSGCSDERTSALHINGVKPDVILVYLGTNDWAFGAELGVRTTLLPGEEYEAFDTAYDSMLKKLKANYPQSEIWCCTLCEAHMSARPEFEFLCEPTGTHIQRYNDLIRGIAKNNGCRLIDLYDFDWPYDSIDGSHPNADGMNTIATMVIHSAIGTEVDPFIDCKDGRHQYKMIGQRECQTYFRCMKCGKAKSVYTWEKLPLIWEEDSANFGEEYIVHDSNGTVELHSEVLHLTAAATGENISFHKPAVTVGRNADCDLLLKERGSVSRQHATFFYEDNTWYLRDDFSKNGTWINGTKLLPGKKYQLAFNDEISFAMEEKFMFEKLNQPVPPAPDPDAKALIFLEAAMSAYAKSGYEDTGALQIILAALKNVPLYFPVEIDLAAMFGATDPTELKAGDTLQPAGDVRMRFLPIQTEDGRSYTPAFTSEEKARGGCHASLIRLYPRDYYPKLIRTGIDVVINPFNEERFIISVTQIQDIQPTVVEGETAHPAAVGELPQESPGDRFTGKTICGRYEVLRPLGKAGVCSTYLVNDTLLKKNWAMKICDKKNADYHPILMSTVLAEADMQRKLSHPAIPRVVDILEEDGGVFILREYIEGETLESVAEREGAMPVDRVVEWGKQLCDVLRYLHMHRPSIIHRDVKPSNMILKLNGDLALIDFGTARTYKPGQTQDTCCLGTRGYAAPEQFGGSQTDARTDIFGLGMTLFRLVTGIDPTTPPYTVKPIRQIDPALPEGLEYIISKCIQPNPNERYTSCDKLLADLNNYLNLPPKGIFGKLFGRK